MISDGTYSEFECALSDDKHFIKEPIVLPCGDCACKNCIPNEENYICNVCNEVINNELVYDKQSKNIKSSFKRNLENLFVIVEKQSIQSLNQLKDIIRDEDKKLDSQIDYIRESIEIKIESIKIKLDKIFEEFKTELNEFKKRYNKTNDVTKKTSTIKNYEEKLRQIKEDIQNKNDLNENKFYEFQANLRSMNQSINKFKNLEFKLVFEPANELKINKKTIGIIKKVEKARKDLEAENLRNKICIACEKGYYYQVDYWNNKHPNLINEFGGSKMWTPLMYAANYKHLRIVEYLIDIGADINAITSNGCTALILAAKSGDLNVTEYLISNDATININSDLGYTALMGASKNGHTKIVEMLLENDALANVKTSDGYTPLQRACQKGHKKIVQMLLAKNANIHTVSNDGFTPLLSAVYNGHKEIAELLLKKNADPNKIAKNGKNCLFYAKKLQKEDLQKLLNKYGAKDI